MYWSRVRSHGCRARLLLAALTICVLPGVADAQDFRGGVVGKVTDESGAVLPGVTVTVMSRDTNVSNTAVTNESGAYTLLYLTPGAYRVSAELQGFKKVQRDNVEVRVGDRLEIDFKLEVGGITEVRQRRRGHAAARHPQRIGRPGHRREAHRADAAVRRQPVRAGAAGARRRLPRRPEVLAPVRQRRHLRLHRRRRPGPQRVHARRLAEHGQRPARRVRAARRRGAGVQGRDRDLRRAAGTHRRRHRERHAEERHQQDQAATPTITTATRVLGGERLLPRARRPAEGGDGLQALRLQRRRPGVPRQAVRRPRQDVLLHRASSGSTTRSRSRASSPCRPRRSATATSRRCSRRASSSTIR